MDVDTPMATSNVDPKLPFLSDILENADEVFDSQDDDGYNNSDDENMEHDANANQMHFKATPRQQGTRMLLSISIHSIGVTCSARPNQQCF